MVRRPLALAIPTSSLLALALRFLVLAPVITTTLYHKQAHQKRVLPVRSARRLKAMSGLAPVKATMLATA